ncbi:MAG: DUF1249 domain-containing protein [Gammaproteobacteria bacterium]|nr:DUF1249 domain-containing protein [Gammaproteobacteria bacterium]
MLVKLDKNRVTQTPPARSFAGLMDLYEYNYLRLRKIAPDLSIADQMVSTVVDHHDLYMTVSERCKYTTMLNMTYRFGMPESYTCEPDLQLKVYHDARLVEVQQLHSRRRGLLDINDEIAHKWIMNRFLYKWLGYCLHQGHFFQPMRQFQRLGKTAVR